MGHGSYQSKDWDRLRTARNINDSSTVQDLYQSRSLKGPLNPYKVKYRESCDSMDNPASTAIIVGLDVTGSMGYLSEEIAKGALNRTMLEIYEKKPVTSPHIMFQAIGDSKSDTAPLQVTQFEADIRIVEQLLDVYFEGRGGGNGGESYLLYGILQLSIRKSTAMRREKKKASSSPSATSVATRTSPAKRLRKSLEMRAATTVPKNFTRWHLKSMRFIIL